MNANYKVIMEYVSDTSDIPEMIEALRKARNKLILMSVSTPENTESVTDHAFYKEMYLKDGQMDTRIFYRHASDLMKDVQMIERQIVSLESRLNGRTTILRSGNL